MADKANAGQAHMVTAAEGLIMVWWCSVAVLLPEPFVLESDSAGVFKGDNMVDGEIPGITVLR